jgi:hypothetical protein
MYNGHIPNMNGNEWYLIRTVQNYERYFCNDNHGTLTFTFGVHEILQCTKFKMADQNNMVLSLHMFCVCVYTHTHTEICLFLK